MRTGIGGAVATFALCREDSTRFLIVGTGTQARFQARAIAALATRRIEIAVWGRSEDKARELREDLQEFGIDVDVAGDLETVCRHADVIVTTTPSNSAIIKDEWIQLGTHITAMGADAPGKQELEEALVARADVLAVDITRQCVEHGEFAGAFRAG